MRGKDARRLFAPAALRITPAHAGKRQRAAGQAQIAQDHPRPCGEKRPRAQVIIFEQGSPPPMRGKAGGMPKGTFARRITPAHAGKRDTAAWYTRILWDHPRPCGEKVPLTTHLLYHTGSPPPMRGKAILKSRAIVADGITPAHAGKSLLALLSQALPRDHPRPCGEKHLPSFGGCR